MSRQIKTYPFTSENLKHFENEMREAGGFEELMISKNALSNDEGERVVVIQPDLDYYKEKFLVGEYENLRESYDTEAPYLFWGSMYEILVKKK